MFGLERTVRNDERSLGVDIYGNEAPALDDSIDSRPQVDRPAEPRLAMKAIVLDFDCVFG
jgi:hypothetical protein